MTSTVWDRTSFSNYYVCYQGILGEFSVHILLAQYIRTMYAVAKKHKEDTESFSFYSTVHCREKHEIGGNGRHTDDDQMRETQMNGGMFTHT